MNFLQSFGDYTLITLITLAFFSVLAGFIDAVAGGGGLIQLPALLIQLPKTNIVTIFGTNKIAGFAGTSIAAIRYSRQIKYNYQLLLTVSVCAAIGGFLGAQILNFIDANAFKPYIFIILLIIAIYTILKKDLGKVKTKSLSLSKQIILGSILGLIIGVYDGFFGPGTGSFLVLGFVLILGFEFIEASAYAKIINAVTNIAALSVFIRHGHFIPILALVMAIANIAGSIIGSHMAIKRGNGFIRIMFILIVSVMILRYGYDIYNAKLIK